MSALESGVDQLFAAKGQVPSLFQAEASECGLVCLAMIAWAYGNKTDMPLLRSRYGLSLKGATLKALMDIAANMGMSGRAVRFELSALSNLQLPCILHWDLNHFVVLTRVTRGVLHLNDPAVGRRRMSVQEASPHVTGIALELTPTISFQRAGPSRTTRISDLWTSTTGISSALAKMLVSIALIEACAIAYPYATQLVVDDAIGSGDIGLIYTVCLGFLLLAVFKASAVFLRSIIGLRASSEIGYQMQANVFNHMLRLPSSFFERRHIGDIVSRFGSISSLQSFLSNDAVTVFIDATLLIATAFVLIIYSPYLLGIAVAALGLSTVAQFAVLPALRERSGEQIQTSARVQSLFLETMRAQRAIKIFSRENERASLWLNAVARAQNAQISVSKIGFVSEAVQAVVWGAEHLLILGVGASLVLKGEMSLGMLFAFQAYSDQFVSRAQSLLHVAMNWRVLALHKGRISDIAQSPQEPGATHPVALRDETPQALSIKEIKFRYSALEPYVIEGLSLDIEAGEFVLINGKSGCGKSTFVKLILGLFPPSEGTMALGSIPLLSIGLGNYRRRLGVVMQDDCLLSGSIADNITFFDQEPDMALAEECARLACVHDDISRLPMGFQSLVGDMGNVLSGGQRQRVMIARALYRRPTIIVMDEGTANLDPETEARIFSNLRTYPAMKIIVSHGPQAGLFADRIITFDQGRIGMIQQSHGEGGVLA